MPEYIEYYNWERDNTTIPTFVRLDGSCGSPMVVYSSPNIKDKDA